MSREDHDRLSTADLAGTDPRMAEPSRPQPQQQVRQESRPAMQEMQPQPAASMREPQMREPQMRPPQMHDGQMHDPRAAQALDGQGRAAPVRDAPTQNARPDSAGGAHQMEQLAALFPPHVAAEFRNHWDQVQIGFVDDPRRAVQQADELVAQVMKSLATSFAEQRSHLEAGLGKGNEVNTENLRVALRGYRSFFQRLLSL